MEEDWDAEIAGIAQPVKTQWQPSSSNRYSNQYNGDQDGHRNNNNQSLSQSQVYTNSAFKGGTRSDERPTGFGMGRGRLANESSNGFNSSRADRSEGNWRTNENENSSKAVKTLSIESHFVGRIIGNAQLKKYNKL